MTSAPTIPATSPTSTSVTNIPVMVEVVATVQMRQQIDLVTFFRSLPPAAQVRYRNLDISEAGMDAEWERPLAYLWPDESDVVPLELVPGASTSTRGQITDAQIRVQSRAEGLVDGRQCEWTEEDFRALLAQVPWMSRVHEAISGLISDEALARITGPDDIPLF